MAILDHIGCEYRISWQPSPYAVTAHYLGDIGPERQREAVMVARGKEFAATHRDALNGNEILVLNIPLVDLSRDDDTTFNLETEMPVHHYTKRTITPEDREYPNYERAILENEEGHPVIAIGVDSIGVPA